MTPPKAQTATTPPQAQPTTTPHDAAEGAYTNNAAEGASNDYDHDGPEMDVDDDDDSLGLGYLGSIVPDASDDVSNMLLAQLGSTPIAAGTSTAFAGSFPAGRELATSRTCPAVKGYAPPGPNACDIRASVVLANPTPGISAKRCAGL